MVIREECGGVCHVCDQPAHAIAVFRVPLLHLLHPINKLESINSLGSNKFELIHPFRCQRGLWDRRHQDQGRAGRGSEEDKIGRKARRDGERGKVSAGPERENCWQQETRI